MRPHQHHVRFQPSLTLPHLTERYYRELMTVRAVCAGV